jgi:hypothetical protein
MEISRRIIIFIVLFILFFTVNEKETAQGSSLYYRGFENHPVGSDFNEGFGKGIRGIPRQACTVKVRDHYPARYGERFLAIECSYPGSCAQRDTAHRGDSVMSTSDTFPMEVNTGKEYWIGWSNYIPEDYEAEYYSKQMVQIMASNKTSYTRWASGQSVSAGQHRYNGYQIYTAQNSGVTGSKALTHTSGTASDGNIYWTYYRSRRDLIWSIRYGGDAEHARADFKGRHKWGDDARGTDTTYEIDPSWADYRGQWVDWVLRIKWYETDHPNAVFQLYMNGDLKWSRTGLRNLPSDRRPQLYTLQAYSSFYNNSYACNPDGSSDYIKQAKVPHQRSAYLDEFRWTDSTKNPSYCTVAPPIWGAKPLIISPKDGETNIDPKSTVHYSGYSNHRMRGLN